MSALRTKRKIGDEFVVVRTYKYISILNYFVRRVVPAQR